MNKVERIKVVVGNRVVSSSGRFGEGGVKGGGGGIVFGEESYDYFRDMGSQKSVSHLVDNEISFINTCSALQEKDVEYDRIKSSMVLEQTLNMDCVNVEKSLNCALTVDNFALHSNHDHISDENAINVVLHDDDSSIVERSDYLERNPEEILTGIPFKVPQVPFKYIKLDKIDTNRSEIQLRDGNSFGGVSQVLVQEMKNRTVMSDYVNFVKYESKYEDCGVFRFVPPSPLQYKDTLDRLWPRTVCDWGKFNDFKAVYDVVRDSALPNYLLVRKPVRSGLNIGEWRKMLVGYGDRVLVDLLEFGWPADYTGNTIPKATLVNHSRDELSDEHISKFIQKELQMGGLLGPFNFMPFDTWFQTSPLMTRPKKNSDKKRIIVDLSYPRGNSVNSGIVKGFYQGFELSFSLPSISDLGRMMIDAGRGSFIWSVDLARAYRQIRTCPLSMPLLGFLHKGSYYVDVCPSFGCRTSALACARTTAAVIWMLEQEGVKAICYLDDFVGVAGSEVEAKRGYYLLLDILRRLGLEVSLDKCVPPARSLVWLGFLADAYCLEVTIPKDKLQEVINLCTLWLRKKLATRKQLQSVIGKLKHIARCIPAAECFFSRLLAFLRSLPYMGSYIIPEGVFLDIRWFISFSEKFNGVCLLPTVEKKLWVIECDSSFKGGGAFSSTHYFAEEYVETVRNSTTNIAHLEALNIVHALMFLLPKSPHNFKIQLNTDNMASQQVLSTGKGRDEILCACARSIWMFAALNCLDVVVIHKPGSSLILADALSRYFLSDRYKAKANRMVVDQNLTRIRVSHDLHNIDSKQ